MQWYARIRKVNRNNMNLDKNQQSITQLPHSPVYEIWRRVAVTTNLVIPLLSESKAIPQWILDKTDYGAPTSPNIHLHKKRGQFDIPQAWKIVSDEKEYWLYNFLWAIEEERFLKIDNPGIQIPSIDDLMSLLSSKESNPQALLLPFIWLRWVNSGKLLKEGIVSWIWSSSGIEGDKRHAHSILVRKDDLRIERSIEFRWIGMSVRFLRKN